MHSSAAEQAIFPADGCNLGFNFSTHWGLEMWDM
jgi:hypothetical protein